VTRLALSLVAGFALACAPSPVRQASPATPPPAASRPMSSEPVVDLTLEGAFALAEERHPELAEARALVEAAAGRVDQAGLLPNPVAVAAMESAPFTGGTTGNAEYLMGASQTIPLGGRLGAARRVEEMERERRVKEAEARRAEIRRRVHGAFATALAASESRSVLADAMALAESALEISRRRLDLGDAVLGDVARAEIGVARSRLDLETAESARERSLGALAAAVGDPRLVVDSASGSLDAVLEVPAIEALSARLEDSPLVAAADAELAVQNARIALAEAQRIPDVDVNLFYRRLEHSDRNAFDVGLRLPLPLFDGGSGRVREARANADAAAARSRATRNDVLADLREARADLAIALRSARALTDEILPRAESLLRTAETRLARGDASVVDLLPLRRDWLDLRLAHLDALRRVMESWASLSALVRASP